MQLTLRGSRSTSRGCPESRHRHSQRRRQPGQGGSQIHSVITNVHGTCASDAKWTQPDSALSQHLRHHLPGTIEIRPFQWSGKNSFTAREIAARELREHIQSVDLEHPGSNQFIVAHSHGGNVALLAAGHKSVKDKVTGIICLSTPFLQAWPRPLGAARIVSAGAGVVLFLSNVVYLALRHWIAPSWLTVAITVLAMPGIWLLGTLALRIARRKTCSLPEFDPKRMLILRTAGDEASAALGAATLFAALVTRIWSFTAQGATRWIDSLEAEKKEQAERAARRARGEYPTLTPLKRWHALLTVAMLIVTITAMILNIARPDWVNTQTTAIVIVVYVLFWLSYAWKKVAGLLIFGPMWWLSCMAMGPVLLLLCMLALFFGPSMAVSHLFLAVAAEPTPPGIWITYQLDPAQTPRGQIGLMHSTLYDDPRAHKIMAQWIRSHFGTTEGDRRKIE